MLRRSYLRLSIVLVLLATGLVLLSRYDRATSAHAADLPVLPIEVIGPDGYIEEVTLSVDDARGVDRLWLQVHRPGYNDQTTNVERGAKASVQINGGEWLDLTNETTQVAEPEASYGGIGGGYHTLRLSVPATGVRAGENTVAFRFNGTDGITSGYRVLALNFLRGGENVLPGNAFGYDDPSTWQPPLSSADDIAAGKDLWESAPLVESPLVDSLALRASCAGCHAQDGRDLKYFNYSNWSIIERSKFHSLSQQEGEQIASYIRSLDVPAPANGRPWNPPYQPGPGLDSRPVEEWAAGAGLEWVLDKDAEMLPFLFPNGTSEAAMAEVVSTRGTLNMRELPIALQLPDWNAWLPEVHPVDVWGEAFYAEEPNQAYLDARAALDNGGAERMRSDQGSIYKGELRGVFDDVRNSVNKFIKQGGPQPCRNDIYSARGWQMLGISGPPADLENGDPNACEVPLRSINHWNAIKQWELFQEFGLEDATDEVYPYGEPRSWVGQHRHVFEMAPHRSANNSFRFQNQDDLIGSYFNTAWYQLQVILQAGNRDPRNHRPPDWKYTLDHLRIASRNSGQWQPLRHTSNYVKMIQNLDMRPPNGMEAKPEHPLGSDRGPESEGWWLWHVNPVWFVVGTDWPSNGTTYMSPKLDEVEPGLRVRVLNAVMATWLEKSTSYAPDEWDRWPSGQSGPQKIDAADYAPQPWDGSGKLFDREHLSEPIFRLVPYFRGIGLDEQIVNDLADWGALMWPRGDWQGLKGEGATIGTGRGLVGEYFADRDFTELKLTRVDPLIDLGWSSGESPHPEIGDDNFGVRWTGQVQPKFSGAVTFHTVSDDGVRLWVDGQLLIDEWRGGNNIRGSGTIELDVEQKYDIVLEYREDTGAAYVRLDWESAELMRELVPTSQLYPGPNAPAPTTTSQPTPQPTPRPTGTPAPQPTAQPTAQPTGQPTAEPTTSPLEMAVVSFSLINADTDEELGPLVEGDVLNLAALPSRNLSVRARTEPSKVGSVEFALDGEAVQVESGAPYAIAGNDGNDYNPWTPPLGKHELAATPYEKAYAQGATGTALRITFTVIDEADATPEPTATPLPTATPEPRQLGLRYAYYESEFKQLPDFDALSPLIEGEVDSFTLDVRQRNDDIALRFTGCVDVPANGEYAFYVTSDDGTQLFVNGELVVNNDGQHAARERRGDVTLRAGTHAIELTFFEHLGKEVLDMQWSGPGVEKQPIPSDALSLNGCEDAPEPDDARVSGFLFIDTNGNGEQDEGEPGLANVTITLTEVESGASYSATTDADGYYAFLDIGERGVYSVSMALSPSYAAVNSSALELTVDDSGNLNAPALGVVDAGDKQPIFDGSDSVFLPLVTGE